MAKPKLKPETTPAETAGTPPAETVQPRCTALDQGSSPAQRCELHEGHEGDHEWTIQGDWPANMKKPGKKNFKAEK
ncbi:MAG TPA: hypothetical protein VF773_10905 [Verrucomicrobiae bacterium]